MLEIHESDIIKICWLVNILTFTTKLSKQYHEHIQLRIFRNTDNIKCFSCCQTANQWNDQYHNLQALNQLQIEDFV